MFAASLVDYRFLRDTRVVMFIYIGALSLLTALFIVGSVSKGAQSWFTFKGFSFQPVDLAKIAVIILLAKYFTKRHIEIASFKHVIISFIYILVPVVLIKLQNDLGGALVVIAIWVTLLIFSGLRPKQLLIIFSIFSILGLGAWQYVLKPYQKNRILNVIDPERDPMGSGYNVIQSKVAIGSGGLLGKGVGYGTQSRLEYLPEYKTDFIFAAYVEEWGFVGAILLFLAYFAIFYKLAKMAMLANSNFESLFTYGVIGWLLFHVLENIGMNLGLAPVTGIPLPFMSYGGSHILAECLAIGIALGMYRYGRATHRSNIKNEFNGLE